MHTQLNDLLIRADQLVTEALALRDAIHRITRQGASPNAVEDVLAAFASMPPFQASWSKNGNYGPREIKRRCPLLARHRIEEVERAMRTLCEQGRLEHAVIGRDKTRRPIKGFVLSVLS